jgi:hypothetical protein
LASVSTPQISETIPSIIDTPQMGIVLTLTPVANITEVALSTPLPIVPVASTIEVTSSTETSTPSLSETPVPVTPTSTLTPEERAAPLSFSLGLMFYMFLFPITILFFGLIIYACLNSLMPIVHVELLDDYE